MGNGLLDILLFAAIAVFLIFKLGSVLGKRTGHEGRPGEQPPFASPEDPMASGEPEENKVVQLPSQRRKAEETDRKIMDSPLSEGIGQIRSADPGFSPSDFLDGANGAFEMILQAYVEGDTRTLKNLLAKDVYQSFATAIQSRNDNGQRIEDTLVGIDSTDILEARMVDTAALVTVKFVSEQVNVLYDAEDEVVEGDPHKVIIVTDIWTFSRDTRSRDPNWTLVSTRSPN